MSTQADQSSAQFKSLLTTPWRTHTPFGDGKLEKMMPFAVVVLDFVGVNVIFLYFFRGFNEGRCCAALA